MKEEDKRQRRVEILSDEAVNKLQAAPHPRQWEKWEEREVLRMHVMLNGNRRRASYFFYIFCSEDIQLLQHGSFCSVFFTTAQSVKRRMLS